MPKAQMAPHVIETEHGPLAELPMPAIKILTRRVNLFGGGYLRLAPQWLIRWGITKLHESGRGAVIYLHPREIDPDQPRLPLGPVRRFKSYVNLKTMLPKLRWLCASYSFAPMRELAARLLPTPAPPPTAGRYVRSLAATPTRDESMPLQNSPHS